MFKKRIELIARVNDCEVDIDNVKIGRRVEISMERNCKIKIGEDVVINDNTRINLGKGASLQIGSNCSIEKNCYLNVMKELLIGDWVTIAYNSTLIDYNHKYVDRTKPIVNQGYDAKGIMIGNNTWIGSHCKLLSGTWLKDTTILGCNTLVKEEYEGNAIIVGTPGKKVKSIYDY